MNKQEMICWRWADTKAFTFQSVLSVDEKSSKSTLSRITRTLSHSSGSTIVSLTPKSNSTQQILKTEITTCHQKIAELEKELEVSPPTRPHFFQ